MSRESLLAQYELEQKIIKDAAGKLKCEIVTEKDGSTFWDLGSKSITDDSAKNMMPQYDMSFTWLRNQKL